MITREQATEIIELLKKIEINTRPISTLYDEVNSIYHLIDDQFKEDKKIRQS